MGIFSLPFLFLLFYAFKYQLPDIVQHCFYTSVSAHLSQTEQVLLSCWLAAVCIFKQN